MRFRVALAWLYSRMVLGAPGGAEDVDAWLAGRELPSKIRERAERLTKLSAIGKVVA